MSLLKQKFLKYPKNLGFTLIELIVVIALFAVLATLIMVNYAGTRGARNLKIAENQMVTNIRKTQSYVLSARNINGSPAKFYAVKFDLNASSYVIQSVDTNYAFNATLETISLPQGITISSIVDTNSGGTASSRSTVQLAYATPYAKLYTYSSADCLAQGSFLAAIQNPACLLTLTDRRVAVTLRDNSSAATRTVTVYGVTGKVESGP
jgi:prepilin-type N-terminal cleavage/methylation domain-containing protein